MGLRTRAFRSLDRRRFFTIVLFYPEKGIELSFFASRGTSLLIPLVNHVFDESSFDSLSYYRFFSRSDFLVVLYQPGHRTELQAGITSIQSYLSWSPNHIDRDRVTANRDEEKVSSVTIDWAGPGTSIRALVPLSNLATRRKLHQDPPWKSHSEGPEKAFGAGYWRKIPSVLVYFTFISSLLEMRSILAEAVTSASLIGLIRASRLVSSWATYSPKLLLPLAVVP